MRLLSEEYERGLESEVQQRTKDVRDREEEIILRLISATGYRDDETGAHVRRSDSMLQRWRKHWDGRPGKSRIFGSPHPCMTWKNRIPDSILRKPSSLNMEEFELMKRHAEIGAQILDGSKVPLIEMARDIAHWHHERWDGSGYPKDWLRKIYRNVLQ